MRKCIYAVLIGLFVISCSREVSADGENKQQRDLTEKGNEDNKQQNALQEEVRESVEATVEKFIESVDKKDFLVAQNFIASDGLYLMELEKIKKSDFTIESLKKLDTISPFYLEWGEETHIMTGVDYLEGISLRRYPIINSSNKKSYETVGWGFTGFIPVTSPLIVDFLNQKNTNTNHVVVYVHEAVNINETLPNILMIELKPEDKKWKICSVGKLIWTP